MMLSSKTLPNSIVLILYSNNAILKHEWDIGRTKMKMNFVANPPKKEQKSISNEDFNLTDAINKSSSYLKRKKSKVRIFRTGYSDAERGAIAGKTMKSSR